MMKGIEISGLSKNYGAVRALDGVDVTFEKDKIYGLLGRNGAGKTTLLNIITGRIFADGGSVRLEGEHTLENDAALRRMYMLSEQTYYHEKMRVAEAFKWSAEFYPDFDVAYANNLSGRFGLDTHARIGGLSTGYNTIFKLIVGLSTNAPYLLFDEPVLGLDANHRDLFYKVLIEKYTERPCCMVLSTHLVEEVSGLVEDVVIIKDGRIIRNEPRERLLADGYTVSGPAGKVDAFSAGRQLLGEDTIGGLKTAYYAGARPDALPEGLELSSMDLQRIFIQLTN